MTRKLASLQIIKELLPIKDADRIELALVQGWQVVVQKGHKVGDMVVYYEIDSFLPETDKRYESFSERFHNWGDKRGMRVKTIKLKKQLSQGVIMPISEFPEVMKTAYSEGTDVTELLGIEKWEPVEKEYTPRNPGNFNPSDNRFPNFLKKTDQERVQNYGTLVQKSVEAQELFEATMKKDGSSLTVFRVDHTSPYFKNAKLTRRKKLGFFAKIIDRVKEFFSPDLEPVFGLCSRNLLLPLQGDSNFHTAVYTNGLFAKLDEMGGSYALQGEVVAPDIQQNHEKVTQVEFHLFDIFDIDSQQYVLPKFRQEVAKVYNIPHATILEESASLVEILKLKADDDVVKAALKYAEGPGDNPGVIREGVVFKSTTRDFSFKAVSNAYLLKTGN